MVREGQGTIHLERSPGSTGDVELIQAGQFFLPGPTEVHPDVLAAQTRPLIGHRGQAMTELYGRLQAGLRSVLGADGPVVISTSSATGLMEAAVRCAEPSRVLCLVGGAFSERFAGIASSSGLDVERLEVPWGRSHDPDDVRGAVRATRPDLVTMVHSETSTGVLNPVPELVAAVRAESDALTVVDTVSSAGGVAVDPMGWGVDFLLTGSQKALAIPPGLAFGVASPRMRARVSAAERPGMYFDLGRALAAAEKGQPPTTPAVTLYWALECQLDRIAREGLGARFERHATMARRCWAWVEGREGLEILADLPSRSPTVTTVLLPGRRGGIQAAADLEAAGFTIGTGYGRMKDEAVRIGHMGDHTVTGLEAVLDTLGEVLDRR